MTQQPYYIENDSVSIFGLSEPEAHCELCGECGRVILASQMGDSSVEGGDRSQIPVGRAERQRRRQPTTRQPARGTTSTRWERRVQEILNEVKSDNQKWNAEMRRKYGITLAQMPRELDRERHALVSPPLAVTTQGEQERETLIRELRRATSARVRKRRTP